MRSSTRAILGASLVGIVALQSQASPLLNYSLLGRIAGSGNAFSSEVTVSTGSQVEYRLVGTFAPVGTVNPGSPARTLTAVTATDGLNNMPKIDLFQTSGAAIDAVFSTPGTQQSYSGTGGTSSWSAGTGNSAGNVTSGDLIGIKNIAGSGQFDQQGNPIYLGSFAIATVTGSNSLVGVRLSGVVSAGSSGFRVHVNNGLTTGNGTNILPVDSTESGANPYISLNGLTLVKLSQIAPSFTAASGLQSGDTGVDALFVNTTAGSTTFSVVDGLISDDDPASVNLALGTLPTELQGFVTQVGRNIVLTSPGGSSPTSGFYSIPLSLSDATDSSPNVGTFTIAVIPEPASIGLLGMGAMVCLRRRRTVAHR